MQSLAPSKTSIKSVTLTRSPLPHPNRLTFTTQSAARRFDSTPNATNPSMPVTKPSSHNFTLESNGLITNRTDRHTSGAILASKVVLNHQNAEKPVGSIGTETITIITNHKTLDLDVAPIKKLPTPLTFSNLSSNATLRVAYQGLPGAYSEIAAGKAYPNCKPLPFDQSELAFQSVELWIADRAVLPIENSLGGSIHRNYDLLHRHRLHIVGELHLSFRHCLLALPGVRTEHINSVISHPQALAQCELTLNKLNKHNKLNKLGCHVKREAVTDTAGAAKFLAENKLHDTAVIASAHAAQIYNLNILTDRIQDDPNNVTRFMMLAREPIVPRTDGPYKTSIVFAQDRGTNVLYKVLSAFEFRNIRLMKIESRPNRDRPVRVVDDENVGMYKRFEYMYYLDFEASMADVRAQNALGEVEEFTSFLRVLGSYPMDDRDPLEGRVTE